MTSSPPPNDAPHYNGRTLSPASPKPIHLPDVENIPVLHNQTDPIFNLVSTHMETSKAPAEDPHSSNPQEAPIQSLGAASAQNGATLNGEEHAQLNEGTSVNELTNANAVATNESFHDHQTISDATGSLPTQPQLNAANFSNNQYLDANASVEVHDFTQDPNQPQGYAIDPAIPEKAGPDLAQSPVKSLNVETGNIQALLDNLIASASSAPAGPEKTSEDPSQSPSPADAQTPISALPTASLPARPPPQDEPAMHPNYAPGQNIRSYHIPPPSNAAQTATGQEQTVFQAPANTVGSNGLQPPPVASFQQTEDSIRREQDAPSMQIDPSRPPGPIGEPGPSPDLDPEQAYQDFLRAEANYVAEGSWDRFPQGSRLFVGNLFTEKVSKRMIWDLFSQYGTLAQISMKNAYGFAQFVDPASCSRAMMSEEGTELGGRKIRKAKHSLRCDCADGDRSRNLEASEEHKKFESK